MTTAADHDHEWPGRPPGSEAHPPHRWRRPWTTPEVHLRESDEVPGTVRIPYTHPGGSPETNLFLAENHLAAAEEGSEAPQTWRHMKKAGGYGGTYLDFCRDQVAMHRWIVEKRAATGAVAREVWEQEQARRNNHDAVYTWALLNDRHRPIRDASDPDLAHYIADYRRVHGRPPKGVQDEEAPHHEVQLGETVAQPALF
ncbi:hypothetical protein [Nesterenkonia sp. PF2B19]|uniref:hypothetical protein n=1 Tax=Nesterenkonia sp. PF2B19 TaxID=1881858 RepID=UPI0008723E15|nr:hypothetical protein [Nesterenkonia sp. PF2B19]OSM43484.1 hypothetical protein BCY76_008170 [Nesterenkonia sp. PF2B19]